MIEFKKNFKKLLPYDRKEYVEFFDDDSDLLKKWYGVSFQIPHNSEEKKITSTEFVEVYNDLFKKVVMKFDNGSFWIVNHDDKDLNWFPDDYDNLVNLRTIFKEKNVPNTFRGALIFTTDDLLKFSKDLILYPYTVLHKDGFLYKDLNISHAQLPFLIKISGHLNIDFLSKNQDILKEVVKENSSDSFIIKEYRGTSIH